MMALRRAVMDSMGPMTTGPMTKKAKERREAVKKKHMDSLGQELELARQLVAECGVDLQLAVRALQGGGGEKAAAVVWIDEQRQRVAGELARQRGREKAQVAKRMKTEGIQLKKNGLRLKNWQPGARYTGWDGNTWHRKEEGKWLRRRVPVGIKVGAAP